EVHTTVYRDGSERGLSRGSGGFRVEQFGETRIVGHVVEVCVAAGLDAVLRIELNGFVKVVETFLGLPRDAVQNCQSIVGIIHQVAVGEQIFKLIASVLVVAGIQQGNRVVVLFL